MSGANIPSVSGMLTRRAAAVSRKALSPRRRSAPIHHRETRQLEALIAGGVPAEARLDPILPALTDSADSLNQHFATLAQVGVKRVAAGVLFLRPAIVQSLRGNVSDKEMLATLIEAYRDKERMIMRGTDLPIQNLPAEARRRIFLRLQHASESHGVELSVCACKNPDLARGSCNIAGTWPRRPPSVVQPLLMK
jgi:hypothetical protein